MKIEEMILTPKIAQAWWNTVTEETQRKFREHHALRLAAVISRGEWQRNNDMFMHSEKGNLGNGQHRCAAVVRAGKSVPIVVAWGCTDAQIMTVDQGGLPRSSSDALHYVGFANTTNMAAIINTIHRDYLGKQFVPSAKECISFAKQNSEKLEQGLALWGKCCRSRCPLEPAILASLLFLASDNTKASKFCEHIADGVTLRKNSPINLLLKKLAENKESKIGKLLRRNKAALTIIAYQNFVAGKEEMPFLRWSPGANQEFPTVP